MTNQVIPTDSPRPEADAARPDAAPRRGVGAQLVVVAVTLLSALLFTTLILLSAGANPLAAYGVIVSGVFSSPIRLADAVMLAAPLLLCSAGLTLTFAAGLYNLGVEGQITLGAVFAMIPLRLLDLPPTTLWLAAIAMGALGGALWALFSVLLKIYGQVSEIFTGLGLNFVATGVALYLVFGPWRRPGVASMSGTEPLPNALWLPTLDGLRLAPVVPVIALVGLALVSFVLTRTRWGLAVRAVGLNPIASERFGVPAARRLVEVMCGCGALAGVAGALQVLAVFHALIPNVSSGIGFLALLVVLLVRASPTWVLPVVLAFAVFAIGSIRLPLTLSIDSSISGVLQGALVLSALLARGLTRRNQR